MSVSGEVVVRRWGGEPRVVCVAVVAVDVFADSRVPERIGHHQNTSSASRSICEALATGFYSWFYLSDSIGISGHF